MTTIRASRVKKGLVDSLKHYCKSIMLGKWTILYKNNIACVYINTFQSIGHKEDLGVKLLFRSFKTISDVLSI